MSQVYEFKVVGLSCEPGKDEIRLEGKFHTIYSSQLFLKLPIGATSKFSIGQIYSLRGPMLTQEQVDEAFTGSHSFEDGSPVPEHPVAPVPEHPVASELDEYERDVTYRREP